MEDAITARALTKRFREKIAVNNLEMHVPKGAIYGFIGKNGAGKSTVQKLISGLLVPTSGTVELNGKPNSDRAERAKLGVLIENAGYFPHASAYENLYIQALNLGLKHRKEAVAEALRTVGLNDVGKQHVQRFSLGMKQRLGVAAALLGSPETLILVEPVNGLDPQGIVDVRSVLMRLNRERGVTVLISSHILGELSKAATHYGIIKDGAVIKEISAEELSAESEDYLNVVADDPFKARSLIASLGTRAEVSGGEVHLYGCRDGGRVNALLAENGVTVSEISFHRIDLETYFMRLTGGEQ